MKTFVKYGSYDMWWKKVDMNTIKNSSFPVTTTNFRQYENKN